MVQKSSSGLASLDKIDYIKCDIEGYELTVFQEIKSLLEKHLPFVQIEIAEKNMQEMLAIFDSLGYTQFGIKNFKFIEEKGVQAEEGDLFFVPAVIFASM